MVKKAFKKNSPSSYRLCLPVKDVFNNFFIKCYSPIENAWWMEKLQHPLQPKPMRASSKYLHQCQRVTSCHIRKVISSSPPQLFMPAVIWALRPHVTSNGRGLVLSICLQQLHDFEGGSNVVDFPEVCICFGTNIGKFFISLCSQQSTEGTFVSLVFWRCESGKLKRMQHNNESAQKII